MYTSRPYWAQAPKGIDYSAKCNAWNASAIGWLEQIQKFLQHKNKYNKKAGDWIACNQTWRIPVWNETERWNFVRPLAVCPNDGDLLCETFYEEDVARNGSHAIFSFQHDTHTQLNRAFCKTRTSFECHKRDELVREFSDRYTKSIGSEAALICTPWQFLDLKFDNMDMLEMCEKAMHDVLPEPVVGIVQGYV